MTAPTGRREIEAADVILMSGELDGVSEALDLSRRTMRTIRQNLFWAFAYNVALIPVLPGPPSQQKGGGAAGNGEGGPIGPAGPGGKITLR